MAINLVLIGILAGLAFILLLPGNTFDSGIGYRMFARIGSEAQWSVGLLTIATVGLWGFLSRSRRVWIMSALALSTMHGLIAFLIAWGNPVSWGTISFSGYAILGYYLVWRRAA